MAQTREELLRGLNGIKKEIAEVNRLQKKAYETGKLRKACQPLLPPRPEYSTGKQRDSACVLAGLFMQFLVIALLFPAGVAEVGILLLACYGIIILIIYKKRNKPSILRRALEIFLMIGLVPDSIETALHSAAVFCLFFFLIKITIKKSRERTQRLNEETAQRNEEIRRHNDEIDSQNAFHVQVLGPAQCLTLNLLCTLITRVTLFPLKKYADVKNH